MGRAALTEEILSSWHPPERAFGFFIGATTGFEREIHEIILSDPNLLSYGRDRGCFLGAVSRDLPD